MKRGMASTSKRRKVWYHGSDFLDEFLIDQAVQHIKYAKLGLLAEHLKIPDFEYKSVVKGSLTEEQKIKHVLSLWHQQLGQTFNVGQFIEEIEQWKSQGFTDNCLWKSLEQFVQPDLLPTPAGQPGSRSDSPVTPPFLITEGKEKSSSEKIHGDHSNHFLTSSQLGENGHYLSDFIKHQKDNPPLGEIKLWTYSMSESKWLELFQFTSSCRYLRVLDLSASVVGEAAHYLAQSIRSWGDDSLLQGLYLISCSIPEHVWPELFQALSSCKQLTDLYLNDKAIGEAGHYLAQLITSWGPDPPIESLYLSDCSIPEQVMAELLQTLSSCKQLYYLDLSGNTIGEAGRYLTQSIKSWGDDPLLERLYLISCAIPEHVWLELLQSLSSCKKLRRFSLDGNTVTGCLSSFLLDVNHRSLESLDLEHTAMNKSDVQYLTHLIQCKLPALKHLWLKEKNWTDVELELEQLKKVCAVHSNGQLILQITSDSDEGKLKPQTFLQENKQTQKHYTQELDEAYRLACEKDTQEVFNAHMNLVGHREAGKTSLATRLMGKKIQEDVKSTEGVSMHLIKTTVKLNLLQGSMWNETSQDSSELFKQFSHAVLLRAKQISAHQEFRPNQMGINRKLISAGNKVLYRKAKALLEKSRKLQKINVHYHRQNSENSEKQQPKKRINYCHKPNWKTKTQTKVPVENKTQTKNYNDNIKTLEQKESMMSEGMRNKILTHEETLEEGQFSDEIPLCIRLWDLGGQNEFLTTQHLFLDVHSTTLIVMDITKPLHQRIEKNSKLGHPNTPTEVLHYWLNSIHAQATEHNVKPSIALVLTHVDLIDAEDCDRFAERYIYDILKTVGKKVYGYLLTQENIYIVNNKSENDADFQKLRNQLICHLSQQITWGHKMPVSWLKLKSDIIENSQLKRHIPFSCVADLAMKNGMSAKDVESFLNIQNIQGDFIFNSSPDLRNTVITDPQWLVDRYSSLITHHRFLDEHNLTPATFLSLKHGYVTENGLEELWEKDQVAFLKNLMTKYNLLVPLDDKQDTGQNYMIPSMLPARNVNIHNLHPFKDMYIVYSAVTNPRVGDTLLVGTFHKLLSESSKTWKLCADDHLSYTDASFEIKQEIRMTLTLLKHNQLRSAVWCSPKAFETYLSEMSSIIDDTRQILSSNMAKMNIAFSDEFQALCPHSLPSDQFPCLVRIRECMDQRNMTLCQRYLKHTCVIHRKKLQTSPSSLFLLAAEITGRRNQTILSTNSRVQQFAMSIHKGYKDYSVAVTDGRKTVVRGCRESSVNIQIAEGAKSIIMKHVHTDFDSIRKSTPKDECLISPVVHLHAHDACEEKESAEFRYKATIPHYLPAGHSLSCVKVRCGNIKRGSLREIGREKPQDGKVPYYKVETNHVILYSNHFCDVVCTSTDKVCTTKVMAFPFGWIGQQKVGIGAITRMKMKTYLTSYLYSDNDLQSKLRNKAATFGYEVLDELTIPFDQEDPDVEKSAVTVGLTVTGPGLWKPTKSTDKRWDSSNREMSQTSKLPGVLTISNGHLCKSEPFDAANFGMLTESAESTFYGNVGVTLHVPNMEDQSRDVDVMIPPDKVKELEVKGTKEANIGGTTGQHLTTTDRSEMRTQNVEQPGSSNEHVETDPEQPPSKRSRKDSSSGRAHTSEEVLTSTLTLIQEPIREHSAVVGSALSDQSSLDIPAEAQPGTSGISPIMPTNLPQSNQGILTPTSVTIGGIQGTSLPQHDSSYNRAALVPFNAQPFGFETVDYNNGQHSLVARQSNQVVGPHADNRQFVTMTRQIETWTSGPAGVMRLGQCSRQDSLPSTEPPAEPPETPVDKQTPWGPRLLMKVADVITNECELTQLGLNLDVDENEINRIICDRGVDTKMAPFKVLSQFDAGSPLDDNEKRHKLRQALWDMGKRNCILKLGI